MRLFGWTQDTWARVAKWAGIEAPHIHDETDWPIALSLRRKWMIAGGPADGPSGKLVGL